MTDHLPNRDFTRLPPPPAGAEGAVRGGRGIRRRRRLTGAGAAAASMAVVAGVLVAAAGGTPHASDELVPGGMPSRAATPAPGSTRSDVGPAAPKRVGRATGSGPGLQPGDAATGRPEAAAAASGSGGPGTAAPGPGGYRTPALVRTYRGAPPPTPPSTSHGPTARLCGGSVTSDEEVRKSSSWCVTPYAVRTSDGHDLRIEVCRDSTGPGALSFGRRLEVDLVVLDGTKPVWRWSAGQPDATAPHGLDVGTDGCWSWTAAWTDVDAAGRPLDPGGYTLSVASTARELDGYPPQDVTFRVS